MAVSTRPVRYSANRMNVNTLTIIGTRRLVEIRTRRKMMKRMVRPPTVMPNGKILEASQQTATIERIDHQAHHGIPARK